MNQKITFNVLFFSLLLLTSSSIYAGCTASPVTKANLTTEATAGNDVTTCDVSGLSDLSSVFYNITGFNQDISAWNTSNVTTMYKMFKNCYNFNSNISKWDVSNVTIMNKMFHDCPKFINSINGYRWNKQYWKIIKESIKMRAIANYWLEQSCISSYAPDGVGRQRDIEAFQQFAIHSL